MKVPAWKFDWDILSDVAARSTLSSPQAALDKLVVQSRPSCNFSLVAFVIFSAAVDDAEYPELNPSGDVKNVKNVDHIKDNSANSLSQTPLNKRRRVDNKKSDDNVEPSVQRGLSKLITVRETTRK